MKLKPLKQWVCDECHEVIKSAEEGFLEWLLDSEKRQAYGFRIVHHAAASPRRQPGETRSEGCYRYTNARGRQDMHLDEYVGTDALVDILAFLDPGPYHQPEYKGPEVRDVREWVELFRRLHLPYYEEARLYWRRAVRDNFFDGANEVAVYSEGRLKALVAEYRDKGEE